MGCQAKVDRGDDTAYFEKMIEPYVDGYLTGTPCGVTPGQTSSVSAARGGIMANALTVGLSAGASMCLFSYAGAHAVFDTTGWWVP